MLKTLFLPLALMITGPSSPAAIPAPSVTVSQPAVDQMSERGILRYEITVANTAGAAIELDSLRVQEGGGGRSGVLADLSGNELKARAVSLTIEPGKSVLIYLDIDLSGRKPPASLVHQVGYRVGGDIAVVETAPRAIAPTAALVLAPPLGPGAWVAIHNAEWPRGHRRMVYAIDGHPTIPGRFAIDWVGVDLEGRVSKGNPDRPQDAVGYGAPVLAVADARVAALRDSMPESLKISANGAHSIDDAAGNYVVLDLGEGRFAFYEHLEPGSISVSVGDVVRRGQPIGALGFTGDSTGPHLHFHVADNPRPLHGEGLPFTIDQFTMCGRYADLAQLGVQPWTEASAGDTRRLERPEGGAVILFSDHNCGA